MTTGRSEQPITLKQAMWLSSAIVGLMMGLVTIHATLIVPALRAQWLDDVDRIVHRELGQHEGRPHRGAADDRDIRAIMERIGRLENTLSARLSRVEEKVK